MSHPPAAALRQSWDPERYARSARFVADLGVPLIELLNPRPGERILDLGCGDGALTEKLAAACRGKEPAAAGGVIGIDSSPDQVEAARKRGLDVHVGDGQRLAYTNEFDAVFSNAALHWMPDGDAVLAGIWRALKPGGRFVAECGGAGNVAIIVSAVSHALRERGIDPEPLDPWVFPAPDDYARQLTAHGFTVDSIRLIPRSTRLPGDIGEWLEMFAASFLDAVPHKDRDTCIDRIRDLLRPELCGSDGVWTADYVRLRFATRKPRS